MKRKTDWLMPLYQRAQMLYPRAEAGRVSFKFDKMLKMVREAEATPEKIEELCDSIMVCTGRLSTWTREYSTVRHLAVTSLEKARLDAMRTDLDGSMFLAYYQKEVCTKLAEILTEELEQLKATSSPTAPMEDSFHPSEGRAFEPLTTYERMLKELLRHPPEVGGARLHNAVAREIYPGGTPSEIKKKGRNVSKRVSEFKAGDKKFKKERIDLIANELQAAGELVNTDLLDAVRRHQV